MDDTDHLEFLDFMNEQELKSETIEANNELAEDINPTVQEINMADIRLHKVTKIEVKKVYKCTGYLCRDIVIHNKEWNSDLGKDINTKTTLDLFLDDKSATKLVYEK